MHSKYILTAVLLSAVALQAGAQSIDPTVEVSRIYKGKMIEVHKPMFEMQVPDSVTQFDLDFDYSVFESPYKGTYEFNPYIQDMKPQPDPWSGRRLFFRAGAGYPLHPVFDLVWSPDLQGRFRMSVYATHRSFIGGYRAISPVADASSGNVVLDSPSGTGTSRIGWRGYDLLTKAGVEGALNWDKGIFSFNAGYYGLATKDTLTRRGYNAFDAGIHLRSKERSGRYFLYDLALDYRYGVDNLDYSDALFGSRSLSGHEISLNSSFGPVFSQEQRLLFDVDADLSSYGSAFGTSAGRVALTPKYVLSKGRWNLGIGVMFSVMFNGGENGLLPAQDTYKGQYAYPDITVGYQIVRDYLQVYADIGGGEKSGRYSDLIERSHFIHPLYTYGSFTPLMDNTVERVSAALGFRGNISSRFSYDLKAGYRNFANAPLFSVFSGSAAMTGGFFTSLGYTGYQMFYASLDYGWESEAFSLDGNFTYCSTDVAGRLMPVTIPAGVSSWTGDTYMAWFAPAGFSGDVRALYNWHKRIYAGADCGFSTARKSSLCSMAGYADLGIYLEFRAARLFSFWLRGGNLLNMTIQHTPMYAESGINFTAGICLNL